MFDQVGFIGLGLIGGSLAKAIKKYGLSKKIIAYDIDKKALDTALSEQVIDIIANDIDDTFKSCSIIFLCCPIKINIEVFKKLTKIVNPTCIITDVGSTKQDIMNAVNALDTDIVFIGGHPMAGSEQSGYNASKAHLFENAYYIITPNELEPSERVDILYQFAKNIKALPLVISPENHDFITAAISHAPHIIASSLVNIVKDLDSKDHYMHTLSAGGFKDITRIASSSPIMWQHISISNKENIIKILKFFKANINRLEKHLVNNNDDAVFSFFDNARHYRDSFQERTAGPLLKYYAVTVDVVDEPGIIATIASLLYKHNINIKNIGIMNNREHSNGVLEIVFYDKISQLNSIDILTSMNYNVYKH